MFKEILEKLNSINEHTKHAIDWASVSIAFGTLLQVLPSIAAALSIVWSVIRIYETKTVQGWIKKWTKPNA
jgi:DMSO reductase anchor subunit